METEKIQKQIESINDAISKGVYSVRFENKEVVYRSLDEMLRTRDLFLNQINKTKQKSRTTRNSFVFSRGL